MLTLEGTDKPFSANNYIYLLFLNILANSTFGHSYDFDEPEFKKLLYIIRDFPKEAGSRVLLWEFSPLIRLIDYKMVTKHRQLFSEMIEISEKNFKKHYIDYDQNIERDFCDALISAKNDALREGKESAPYLTDNNLVMAIFDIFFAGTDTSQRTFQWMLLIMLYYREIQNKLRQEVESLIGDRMPTHEDRHRCHYIMAFISEILRFRNVVPTGVFHKAVVTSKIEEHTIPEGMSVFAYQGIVLRNDDNKYWTNSNDFKPERFLNSDGHYMTTRSPAFIPFGVGRRVCLGEKLAIADLFLVLVRFLQSTQKYDLVLENNKGIDVDPNDPNYTPFDYKIITYGTTSHVSPVLELNNNCL
ncbi:steroid 17-alpha-hydroxylase/17,20 lyase-like [Oppia nitens]|uniref:steroid 17-alpha-hydroxylase/17,20 lyase-like n=1 Tax=Oppia nitens TaxID=1686743 RepID=UPI0023DBD68D|nr:steroid 17-alpha-hydroxylase/17,20 lyase-like [Oppia nitens]